MDAEKLTPRGKRLLVIAMVTPWLFLAVYFGAPLLNPQMRNLQAIQAHIDKITPQWDKFRAEHPGFDEVKLFAYTGNDGLFGAYGHIATDEQLADLRKYMESTAPPRPVFVDAVKVTGPEFIEGLKKEAKQHATANRR